MTRPFNRYRDRLRAHLTAVAKNAIESHDDVLEDENPDNFVQEVVLVHDYNGGTRKLLGQADTLKVVW